MSSIVCEHEKTIIKLGIANDRITELEKEQFSAQKALRDRDGLMAKLAAAQAEVDQGKVDLVEMEHQLHAAHLLSGSILTFSKWLSWVDNWGQRHREVKR